MSNYVVPPLSDADNRRIAALVEAVENDNIALMNAVVNDEVRAIACYVADDDEGNYIVVPMAAMLTPRDVFGDPFGRFIEGTVIGQCSRCRSNGVTTYHASADDDCPVCGAPPIQQFEVAATEDSFSELMRQEGMRRVLYSFEQLDARSQDAVYQLLTLRRAHTDETE